MLSAVRKKISAKLLNLQKLKSVLPLSINTAKENWFMESCRFHEVGRSHNSGMREHPERILVSLCMDW